jgi:hypothetical protein
VRTKVVNVDLLAVRRDPTQPRRLPSALMRVWDGSAAGVGDMFQAWYALASEERGEAFPLHDYFDGKVFADALTDDWMGARPIGAVLVQLINLALDILHNGLTNPIHLVRLDETSFALETGERRWLAYHLLRLKFPEDQTWSKIPAIIEKQFSRWRQAGENGARQNLNAIGTARQLALLIMDLQGHPFARYDALVTPDGCDRPFYAQVADGAVYRVPRGKAEMLLAATGLKHPSQIRQYRALLTLPDDLWTQADDENWPEGQIRQKLAALKRKPKRTVTVVTVSPVHRWADRFLASNPDNMQRRAVASELRSLADRLEGVDGESSP